jgi:lysophospholipase L1-like esterase
MRSILAEKKIAIIRTKTIIKNLVLFAASFALSLLAVIASSRLYADFLGIRDPFFLYENKLNMWHSEPTIGFVNKPNFSSFCFGTVRVQTNEHGFRGTQPTLYLRANEAPRIVGLGDSVMWGTGVDEEESILGLLKKKLNERSPHEVINAGVVGYSTYQELLYLEKYILPLKPDVVLVNYCVNDLLPTEDPFKNVRRIYIQYLSQLLESHNLAFTPEEKSDIKELTRIFDSAEHVWRTLHGLEAKSPKWVHLIAKVFVKIPMERMAELSREAGVRLIYVFIPPKEDQAKYAHTVEQLKKVLVENGAEFVDVQPALVPDKNELTKRRHMERSPLAWVWPPELKQLLILWSIQTIHRRHKFIDFVHPTEQGNAIIAEHIYRYLMETSNLRRRRFLNR